MNLPSPHDFGGIFMAIMLLMTASSYFIHKHRVVEKILSMRITRISSWYYLVANSLLGVCLFAYDWLLALMVLYVSVMIYMIIKGNGLFPWAIGIVKIGYMFSAIYFVLYGFLTMGFWERLFKLM